MSGRVESNASKMHTLWFETQTVTQWFVIKWFLYCEKFNIFNCLTSSLQIGIHCRNNLIFPIVSNQISALRLPAFVLRQMHTMCACLMYVRRLLWIHVCPFSLPNFISHACKMVRSIGWFSRRWSNACMQNANNVNRIEATKAYA